MAGAILLAKPGEKRKSSEDDKENQPLSKIAPPDLDNEVDTVAVPSDCESDIPIVSAAPTGHVPGTGSSGTAVEMIVMRQQELRRQELSNDRARIDNAIKDNEGDG